MKEKGETSCTREWTKRTFTWITTMRISITHPWGTYSYMLQYPHVSFVIKFDYTALLRKNIEIYYTFGWKGI